MTNNSCNSISLIEFCFENTEKDKNNVALSILLGSIDDVVPDGTSFTGRLFVQKTINTTVNCNLKLTKDSVCCQSERINVSLPTQLQINAFGIEFPNQTLLEYNDSENVVETFVGTSLDFRGFVNSPGAQQPVLMLQGNGRFMNLNLRFLRFVTEESPDSNSGSVVNNIVLVTVLATGGGLIILIFLLGITVLIFAIKWRKRKKMIISKDPQKAFDNANC